MNLILYFENPGLKILGEPSRREGSVGGIAFRPCRSLGIQLRGPEWGFQGASMASAAEPVKKKPNADLALKAEALYT